MLLKGKTRIKDYPKVLQVLNHNKSLSTHQDWWFLSLCWLSGEKHADCVFCIQMQTAVLEPVDSGTMAPESIAAAWIELA